MEDRLLCAPGGRDPVCGEGEDHGLKAGQAIAVEAGLERSWQNNGDTRLELLVITITLYLLITITLHASTMALARI